MHPRILKEEEISKVKIRVKEFVIDDLEWAKTGNERYDYYSVIKKLL